MAWALIYMWELYNGRTLKAYDQLSKDLISVWTEILKRLKQEPNEENEKVYFWLNTHVRTEEMKFGFKYEEDDLIPGLYVCEGWYKSELLDSEEVKNMEIIL